MQLYLDADVFLALIKSDDRFKQKARAFFNEHKHRYITSTLTCLEVWFYLHKHGLVEQASDAVRAIEELAQVMPFSVQDMHDGMVLAKEHKLTPADAVHAVLAKQTGAIVSSDKSLSKIRGLKRIDFTA